MQNNSVGRNLNIFYCDNITTAIRIMCAGLSDGWSGRPAAAPLSAARAMPSV